MEEYWKVVVTVEHIDGDKVKKVKEEYIVKGAMSVMDVEVKVNEFFKDTTIDFEVFSVTKTKIRDVIG